MTDETYTFVEHQRSTKAMANGARHRVCGSKSKKCTMPSDYMTVAQRRRMNGAMKTYEMNKPHTLKELRDWPEAIAAEYLLKLRSEYNPSNTDMGRMLGIRAESVSRYYKDLGISRRGRSTRRTPEQERGFCAFAGLDETEDTGAHALTLSVSRPGVQGKLSGIGFTVTANLQPVLEALAPITGRISLPESAADPDDMYEITIHAVRKEN